MQIKNILTAMGLAATLIGGSAVTANAEPYHGDYGYHDRDRGDRHDRDDWRFRDRDDHRRFDRDRHDGDRHFHHFGFIRF
ncbi:MAG TPA: hypothetical protein VJ476_09165 [Rhizomicrobium sp.]|nr:hypothetical protein [Rhizomicrobium sp.]